MSEVVALGTLAVFTMILIFVFISTCIERYKIKFGHEASFILLLGILLSWILDYSSLDLQHYHKQIMDYVKFDQNLFFYLCLPPIVFASGFNMRKAKFFANIDSVLLFGLFGTFVCFTFFSLMTIYTIQMWEMSEYNGKTGETKKLVLQNQECLLMCSLLSSSDVVAAVSLINFELEPDLYSIVFGEGITNDAVSIILFNTVMRYTAKNSKITWTTPFVIVYEFFKLGMWSLIIGIVIGMLSSLMFKNFRSLTMNPTAETMTIFIYGYISYIVSEMSGNSGIITLLTCGIVMSHYTWYNLSPLGKHCTFIVFEFLGKLSESFVFIYLGVTLFSFKENRWSWNLVVAEIFIVIIGRLFGTIGLLEIFQRCCGMKSSLNIKQQIFVWFAGMIRGAIAFGLVLRIDKSFVNRDVIITTSLSLVIFTTVFFGSTLGVLQKMLFGDQEKKGEQELKSSRHNSARKSNENSEQRQKEMEQQKKDEDKLSQLKEKLINNSRKSDDTSGEDMSDDSDSSDEENEETEGFEVHPNFEENPSSKFMSKKQKKLKKKKCKHYFLTCDKFILRPVLIYKYEKQMQKKSKQFLEIYQKFGEEVAEDDYNYQQSVLKRAKTQSKQEMDKLSNQFDGSKSDKSRKRKSQQPKIKKFLQDPKNLNTNSPVIPENPAEHHNDMAPSLEPQEAQGQKK